MDLWHILWDIGIIKFNDNGPRLITKPPLRKEPQLCPVDTHQRRNSANAPRQRVSPQCEQTTSAGLHTRRLPRMPLPILQTEGTMKLCQGHFRAAGCELRPAPLLLPY